MSEQPAAVSLGTSEESDESLMRRVQGDDPVAFGRLYDRHAAPALAIAKSVLRDAGAAEEAVQEAFISIWRGRAGYRTEVNASFRGWAMTTVRNRAIDSHRSQRAAKRPRIADGAVDEVPEPASSHVIDRFAQVDERETLNRLVARLPVAQAEVITLAFYGELSHTEIAEQLGLPAGTVKGRMRLGLEKLRYAMNVRD